MTAMESASLLDATARVKEWLRVRKIDPDVAGGNALVPDAEFHKRLVDFLSSMERKRQATADLLIPLASTGDSVDVSVDTFAGKSLASRVREAKDVETLRASLDSYGSARRAAAAMEREGHALDTALDSSFPLAAEGVADVSGRDSDVVYTERTWDSSQGSDLVASGYRGDGAPTNKWLFEAFGPHDPPPERSLAHSPAPTSHRIHAAGVGTLLGGPIAVGDTSLGDYTAPGTSLASSEANPATLSSFRPPGLGPSNVLGRGLGALTERQGARTPPPTTWHSHPGRGTPGIRGPASAGGSGYKGITRQGGMGTPSGPGAWGGAADSPATGTPDRFTKSFTQDDGRVPGPPAGGRHRRYSDSAPDGRAGGGGIYSGGRAAAGQPGPGGAPRADASMTRSTKRATNASGGSGASHPSGTIHTSGGRHGAAAMPSPLDNRPKWGVRNPAQEKAAKAAAAAQALFGSSGLGKGGRPRPRSAFATPSPNKVPVGLASLRARAFSASAAPAVPTVHYPEALPTGTAGGGFDALASAGGAPPGQAAKGRWSEDTGGAPALPLQGQPQGRVLGDGGGGVGPLMGVAGLGIPSPGVPHGLFVHAAGRYSDVGTAGRHRNDHEDESRLHGRHDHRFDQGGRRGRRSLDGDGGQHYPHRNGPVLSRGGLGPRPSRYSEGDDLDLDVDGVDPSTGIRVAHIDAAAAVDEQFAALEARARAALAAEAARAEYKGRLSPEVPLARFMLPTEVSWCGWWH
eukprot:jgi/Mesvir1/15690/Mv03281-RA.2